MDTKKIGAFLKQCRKENNLTQEQLAEKFGVSARTVSRWETGSNMPDLSILVELADYYDIEIKELLDGERSSTMNKEMKETLNKVADYEDWVKQKALKAGNLAFSQETGASVAMHGAPGFGMYGVDVLVEGDEAKKAIQIIEAADDSQSKEKF